MIFGTYHQQFFRTGPENYFDIFLGVNSNVRNFLTCGAPIFDAGQVLFVVNHLGGVLAGVEDDVLLQDLVDDVAHEGPQTL